MKKVFTLLFLFTMAFYSLQAQENSEAKQTDSKEDKTPKGFYTPQLMGAVKVKFETSLDNAYYRFNVRNSRLGVKGNAARNLKYVSQIELNNEGKLTVLDAYATYSPFSFLDFTLGQQLNQFSTEVGRGPNSNMFANRSLLAKYTLNYYYLDGNKYKFGSLGSRDIGLVTTFKYKLLVPAKTIVGLFNGTGINDPEWNKSINMNFRQEFGSNDGFKVAGSYYFGKLQNQFRTDMWDIEMRYCRDALTLESEFAQRTFRSFERQTSTAWVIQGYYDFKLPENKLAKSVLPLLRYDLANHLVYKADTGNKDELDPANIYGSDNVSRITAGVNFRLTNKPAQSEIRFQYEHYIMKNKPADFKTNQLFHDKFSVEIVASF